MNTSISFDPIFTEDILVRFIRDETKKFDINRIVIGLSGGLDSSVSATLAVKALGKENVYGFILPYKTTSKGSLDDAQLIVKMLGIQAETIDITPIVDNYFKTDNVDKVRKGNFIARIRMCILFDKSNELNALVLGTSNKTELLLGYGTIYGDMASAINPLGDLYKTQIRILAKEIGIPERIIFKPPTADLWIGQTDEGELGITYEEADDILYNLIERRIPPSILIERGYDVTKINKIIGLVKRNQFKRSLPIIAKLTNRTIGIDFKYPRDWGR
ncbi:MAG: NAD+ synthase [bacterium]|nr:NAD+ synthase [bacterium]